jgi:hypothetical protein
MRREQYKTFSEKSTLERGQGDVLKTANRTGVQGASNVESRREGYKCRDFARG